MSRIGIQISLCYWIFCIHSSEEIIKDTGLHEFQILEVAFVLYDRSHVVDKFALGFFVRIWKLIQRIEAIHSFTFQSHS